MKSFYMLTLLSLTFTMLHGQTPPATIDMAQPSVATAVSTESAPDMMPPAPAEEVKPTTPEAFAPAAPKAAEPIVKPEEKLAEAVVTTPVVAPEVPVVTTPFVAIVPEEKPIEKFEPIKVLVERKVEVEVPGLSEGKKELMKLKVKLGKKYLELSELGLSIAPTHVKAIKELRKKINMLEQKHGIRALQTKVGEMKIKACEVQQIPELKKLYDQIEALQTEVKELTMDEQAEIEKLSAQKIQKDNPKYKKYQARLEELNNAIQEKAADQLEKIVKLNDQILKNPENAKILASVKGKKFGTMLKKKLTALKDTIKPLDEKISKHIEEINKLDTEEQLKQIRIDIKKIKDAIMKYDPCFSAKESLKDRGWLEYFVF